MASERSGKGKSGWKLNKQLIMFYIISKNTLNHELKEVGQ